MLAPFDGLLLAGGDDIEPARYGAADHPEQYGIDPDRDQLELELARAAVRTGLPTLGICRGVQLLNVAFGGTLVQHLPELDGPAEPRVEHRNEANQAIHNLRVEPDSRLAEAIGQLEAEGAPTTTRASTASGTGSGRSPGRRTGWWRGSSATRAGPSGCSGIPRAPPAPTPPSTGCCAPSWMWRPGVDSRFGVHAQSR